MKKRIFGMLLMGAMVVASVSMFTSCKDYDDDINKLQKEVDAAALKTDLESLRSSLTSELASAKSALESAIAAKANASDLAGLATDDDLNALAATVATLSTQIGAVENAIGENDINTMATTIAAVSGDMTALENALGEEEAARKAVEANLDLQQKALDELAKQVEELAKKDNSYDDTAIKADIKSLQSAVKALQSAGYTTKSDLQKAINDLNAELSAKIPNVSLLTALVNKMLTSITLVPELYIKGVEAIEFKSLKYTPAKFVKGANTNIFNDGIPTDLQSAGSSAVIRDMKGKEASYRLSPKAVKLEDLDVDNIAVFNKTAQTRAATTTKNSPVSYVKESAKIADGILTVTLQKTGKDALKNTEEPGNIDIVSLMVPRKEIKEKNQTYEEIYSEFVRVVETTFTPRIAALPYYEDKKLKHDKASDLTYHYSDSLTIWSDDAATANTKLVKKEIKYDADFDLRTLVTGCILNTGHKMESEMTKDELKEYGLEFRFAVPATVYNTNAQHKTDQQKFAKIKADGYTLISRIENGTEKNKAAVDKEPIIRVTLVDTKNSNAIVDLRYFKIKWIEQETPAEKKPEVNLDPISKEIPFSCEAVDVDITWQQFINDIYGKVTEGKKDMSQTTFEEIYPVKNVQVTVSPAKDAEGGDISKPVVQNTTNKEGDALIAKWTLDGVDFGTIPADGKTLTATITFKSSKPYSYGDLKLQWNVTRKLPAAPSLFGYNANQWFETGEKFYVQPVQYGTKDSKGVTRTDYVSYDFNVMQQFTVATATAKGTYLNWILKGLQDCGSWDMQFAKTQVNTNYFPAYTGSEPLTTEDVAFAGYGAYTLLKNPTATALKLNWLNAGHLSWKNKEDKPYAVLNGEKENATAIIPLLNNLSKDNEADNWTPKKTNADQKSVTLKVWAKYNKWNWTPVTTFKAYLVTPIRINHEIDGVFEDNWISGTVVDALGKLGITDFVGYAVAKNASGKAGERYKYETQLWNYYGVQDPEFALGDNIKYGLKMDGGSLVVDNNVEVNADGSNITGGMTQSQVKKNTGGAYEWSLTATGGKLVFKNETGRAFDKKFNVFVPVTVKHYFGEVTMYVKIPVYPKGQAAADGKTVVPGA